MTKLLVSVGLIAATTTLVGCLEDATLPRPDLDVGDDKSVQWIAEACIEDQYGGTPIEMQPAQTAVWYGELGEPRFNKDKPDDDSLIAFDTAGNRCLSVFLVDTGVAEGRPPVPDLQIIHWPAKGSAGKQTYWVQAGAEMVQFQSSQAAGAWQLSMQATQSYACGEGPMYAVAFGSCSAPSS